MNKRKPYIKNPKRGNWTQPWTTPFSLKDKNTQSLAEIKAANRRSFNALISLSGQGGVTLDDPIIIRRTKPSQKPSALQP